MIEMKQELAWLTFFNISDTDRFFGMVNDCSAPVLLRMPNGKARDLRFNFAAQQMLTWLDPSGHIRQLKLQCSDPQDVEQLTRFMLDGKR